MSTNPVDAFKSLVTKRAKNDALLHISIATHRSGGDSSAAMAEVIAADEDDNLDGKRRCFICLKLGKPHPNEMTYVPCPTEVGSEGMPGYYRHHACGPGSEAWHVFMRRIGRKDETLHWNTLRKENM